MESHQDPSLFSSLQQILDELENFIVLESSRNGNPWTKVAKLTELFYAEYGVSLEEVVRLQGYNDGLRSLFASSKRFSIYSTQIPQEFYIALFQAVMPSFHQFQKTSIKYRIRIKQPWKVDGRLLGTLKAEEAEEILPHQVQRISEYQPLLVPEIESVNDLETALVEIIGSLTANHLKKFITISVLSKKFCDCYKQPVRTVIRSVCPDMKLIELLQTIPGLQIQKVNNDWQIAIESHSIE